MVLKLRGVMRNTFLFNSDRRYRQTLLLSWWSSSYMKFQQYSAVFWGFFCGGGGSLLISFAGLETKLRNELRLYCLVSVWSSSGLASLCSGKEVRWVRRWRYLKIYVTTFQFNLFWGWGGRTASLHNNLIIHLARLVKCKDKNPL